MKESDSKLEDTLKPFQSDGIKDYEDMEVDEDVSSENWANKVNDTHTFKNSLVVSKGSTKRGFKIEDLPELDWSNSTKEIRCISFKMEMLQKDKISLYPVQEENSL